MTDALTWTQLGVIASFLGLMVSAWKIRASDHRDIDRRFQTQSIDLAAFKLQVMERHPTMDELADAERRFLEANRVTVEAINKLSDRIDRMLERKG